MPLSINTNIASMTAQRSFLNSNAALETAFERLSTGKRINSAVDDAAGLSIGKNMESRVSGLNQAIRNVNDGISMVQIAEGALDEVTTILQKMRDISVQASNASMDTNEMAYLDTEQSKLAAALDDVVVQAKFNGIALFDKGNSASDKTLTLQSGANNGETTDVVISDVSAAILSVSAGSLVNTHEKNVFDVLTDSDISGATAVKIQMDTNADGTQDVDIALSTSVATVDDVVAELNSLASTAVSAFTYTNNNGVITAVADASGAITTTSLAIDLDGTETTSTNSAATTAAGLTVIDNALNTVASNRATLGATQAQLESTVRNLSNVAENTAAAASRIMDTDYAAETANLTKAQILQQAATSVLAQANAQPQAVLALLQ